MVSAPYQYYLRVSIKWYVYTVASTAASAAQPGTAGRETASEVPSASTTAGISFFYDDGQEGEGQPAEGQSVQAEEADGEPSVEESPADTQPGPSSQCLLHLQFASCRSWSTRFTVMNHFFLSCWCLFYLNINYFPSCLNCISWVDSFHESSLFIFFSRFLN